MWTERKKQIGPIAARRGTLKPGGIPDGGAAGKEERHVD